MERTHKPDGLYISTNALILLLAIVLLLIRRALPQSEPLNDHLKAKRVTHFDFKPSEEAAA